MGIGGWDGRNLCYGLEVFRDSEGLCHVSYSGDLRCCSIPCVRNNSGDVWVRCEWICRRALALDASSSRDTSRDRLESGSDGNRRKTEAGSTRARIDRCERVR